MESQWTWEARIQRGKPDPDLPMPPVLVLVYRDLVPLFVKWLASDQCPLDQWTVDRIMAEVRKGMLPCAKEAWSATNEKLAGANP